MALFENIRLGWKCLAVPNALAYNTSVLFTIVKMFFGLSPVQQNWTEKQLLIFKSLQILLQAIPSFIVFSFIEKHLLIH